VVTRTSHSYRHGQRVALLAADNHSGRGYHWWPSRWAGDDSRLLDQHRGQRHTRVRASKCRAFDDTHIWVANAGDNTVTELNLDGSVAGTFHVGSAPRSITTDGAHICVANSADGTLTELNSDGSQADTLDVSNNPLAITWDGPTSGWPMPATTP
jgi:hypothetical protein